MARGGPLEAAFRRLLRAHLEGCPECVQLFEEQCALHAALESLAAEDLPGDGAIASKVLREFDKVRAGGGPVRVPVKRWMLAAGLAALMLSGAFWTLRKAPAPPVAARGEAQESPFLTIPYTIPLAPEERADVVRMRIPVSTLLAVGFRVPMVDPAADVDAEVLVSADGRARAIRPIAISRSN